MLKTHHSHAFPQHEDKRLLIDGAWIGDEEVCEGQMEEGDRCYNRFGRYERHRCVLLPLGMVVSVYLARPYRVRRRMKLPQVAKGGETGGKKGDAQEAKKK